MVKWITLLGKVRREKNMLDLVIKRLLMTLGEVSVMSCGDKARLHTGTDVSQSIVCELPASESPRLLVRNEEPRDLLFFYQIGILGLG